MSEHEHNAAPAASTIAQTGAQPASAAKRAAACFEEIAALAAAVDF